MEENKNPISENISEENVSKEAAPEVTAPQETVSQESNEAPKTNEAPVKKEVKPAPKKASIIDKLGKKKLIAIIAAVLVVAILVPVLILLPKNEAQAPDAFVIMTEQLDGLFNPFFATSGNPKFSATPCKNSSFTFAPFV